MLLKEYKTRINLCQETNQTLICLWQVSMILPLICIKSKRLTKSPWNRALSPTISLVINSNTCQLKISNKNIKTMLSNLTKTRRTNMEKRMTLREDQLRVIDLQKFNNHHLSSIRKKSKSMNKTITNKNRNRKIIMRKSRSKSKTILNNQLILLNLVKKITMQRLTRMKTIMSISKTNMTMFNVTTD